VLITSKPLGSAKPSRPRISMDLHYLCRHPGLTFDQCIPHLHLTISGHVGVLPRSSELLSPSNLFLVIIQPISLYFWLVTPSHREPHRKRLFTRLNCLNAGQADATPGDLRVPEVLAGFATYRKEVVHAPLRGQPDNRRRQRTTPSSRSRCRSRRQYSQSEKYAIPWASGWPRRETQSHTNALA
jgi:hypothetical protein